VTVSFNCNSLDSKVLFALGLYSTLQIAYCIITWLHQDPMLEFQAVVSCWPVHLCPNALASI